MRVRAKMMIASVADLSECPDCASANIRRSELRDQLICKDCGLIFEPLEPEMEEKFEKTHNLTMGARKKTKAKPKAKRKRK